MPTKNEHIDWAEKNEAFAKSFSLQSQIEINWGITALFYSAVHHVDAYLVSRGKARFDHRSRETSMKDTFFDAIREDYKSLKDLSREARYNIAQFSKEDFRRANQSLQKVKKHILPKVSQC